MTPRVPTFSRRELGLLLAGLPAVVACSQSSSADVAQVTGTTSAPPRTAKPSAAASTPPRVTSAEPTASATTPREPVVGWQSTSFAANSERPDGQAARVYTPANSAALSTLIALHGKGESERGIDAGARGWEVDYELGKIIERLGAPPLLSKDAKDFIGPARLKKINESLGKASWDGLNVACPFTPNLNQPKADGAQGYARFLIDELLPRVDELSRSTRTRERTGIDGVSMGGRMALLVGFTHPEVFGSVGALQPQLRVAEAEMFADLAVQATKSHPIAIKLVTSGDDYFYDSVQALSKELDERGVKHKKVVTMGPHDYIWNKGPGGLEMLFFHERAHRGLDVI